MAKGPSVDQVRRNRLLWAVAITGAFFVLEVAGGFLSGSLALLSDAGHMLTDLASLLVSLTALQFAARPAGGRHTYGFARLEVLAALVNSFAFFALIGAVAWEATRRLQQPALPNLELLGVVAALGLLANIAVAAILWGAESHDLNLQSALLHVMGDLGSSVAVLAGAFIMGRTGWAWVDPVLSIVIAVVVAAAAVRLFLKAWHILLESAPKGLGEDQVRASLLASVPEILEVHHVHVWEVVPGQLNLTAHLVMADRPLHEVGALTGKAAESVKTNLGIAHATFQVEAKGPVRVPFTPPNS